MEASVVTEILTQMGNKSGEAPDSFKSKSAQKLKPLDEYDIYSDELPPQHFVWRNLLAFIFMHTTAAYGLFALMTGRLMWQTAIWGAIVLGYGSFGITGGAHRLWAHKCYKAKLPLRIILTVAQTMALQNCIWEWCRDHRVHHKYTETHADPHNAKRGFFFSHMGWLLVRKHPAVKQKGKTIDMSDLEADPIIMFQKKFYLILAPLFCFAIPSFVPWFFWGETEVNSFCYAAMFRYTLSLHLTWTINSVAHMWGNKPYDKNIGPVESNWAWFSTGEGWHNYHHTFPWDYKAAELGGFVHNSTAFFIDQFAKIGWAYDLKTVPKNIIEQRIKRTGDGTHPDNFGVEGHHHAERGPCAWGDVDIPPENVAVTQTLYPNKDE